MNLFDKQALSDDVAHTLIEASVKFRPDQINAYKIAFDAEESEQAKWVLRNILENASVGESKKLPLCDDTGIPHLFLEIGQDATIPAGFFQALEEGVRKGLRELPGRPMAVRGNDELIRLEQSDGMFEESEMLQMAPLQLRHTIGSTIKLTLLMYGGGPEIRGKTCRVFHKHSSEIIKKEMVAWGLEGAKFLGCSPVVLAYGIGRSNLEAASLAMEAMAKGEFGRHSGFEEKITKEINRSNIGPLGIGGMTTVLGTFVRIGPQRASGVRIVSLRVGCCFDPRRAVCEWEFHK
jgi:fumarate hydratase subunit alpha